MSFCVCGGAMLTCSFGMTPSVLNVLPVARVVSNTPLATIMDNVPLVNVMPFGLCRSFRYLDYEQNRCTAPPGMPYYRGAGISLHDDHDLPGQFDPFYRDPKRLFQRGHDLRHQ